jgi:hypothetical protein
LENFQRVEHIEKVFGNLKRVKYELTTPHGRELFRASCTSLIRQATRIPVSTTVIDWHREKQAAGGDTNTLAECVVSKLRLYTTAKDGLTSRLLNESRKFDLNSIKLEYDRHRYLLLAIAESLLDMVS